MYSLPGKKFSRFVLFGAVAAAVAICSLGCSKQRSEQYRQEGDMYYDLGNYSQAEEAYRRATEVDPENAQALQGLGNVWAASGKSEEALASYEKAISLDPQNDRNYLEASKLLMSLGMPGEGEAIAERLEEVNPELGGILHSSLLLRSGRETEAVALLENLHSRFPDSDRVRTHLAYGLLATGNGSMAEATLKEALELQPNSAIGANMVMVESLAAMGRLSEITDNRDLLESQDPDQAIVYAHALNLAGRQEEGVKIIKELLERDSTSQWANYALGSFLLDAGRPDEAAKYLRKAAEAMPWEPAVMYVTFTPGKMVADASITSGAEKLPISEETTNVPAGTQDTWQALWNQAALGRLLEQRADFEDDGSGKLNETLVLAALFHGNNDLAEEMANKLPDGSPAKNYIAGLRNGELQTALDALRPWTEGDGAERVMAMNAMGYIMALGNARNDAVQVLAACVKQYPENGVSLYNMAQVFRVAEMPQYAALALRRLTAMFPGNVEAHVSLVQLLRDAGMQEEARQAAEAMYAIFPESRDAVLAVCGTYMDTSQLEPARRVLDAYLESQPNDPKVQFTRAFILALEGKQGEALDTLETLTVSDEMHSGVVTLTALCHAMGQNWQGVVDVCGTESLDTLSSPARFVLSAAWVKTGQSGKAVDTLTDASTSKPHGRAESAIILSALGGGESSVTEREPALSKALTSDVNTLADFASGVAYLEAKVYDEAYQAFRRVDEVLTGESESLTQLILLSLPNAIQIEDPKAEVAAFVDRHEESAAAWLASAAMLRRLDDLDGERAALNKAVEIAPEDPRVYIRRGDFHARQDEIDAAIEDFRRHVELRPDDPIGNNNLAYNLSLAGKDIEQALKSAQVAADALPQNPRVLHTLGVAQLKHGDLEESKKNLSLALQRMPGEPDLLLDYAHVLDELGELGDARKHAESALNSADILGADFKRRAEAEALLARVKSVSET